MATLVSTAKSFLDGFPELVSGRALGYFFPRDPILEAIVAIVTYVCEEDLTNTWDIEPAYDKSSSRVLKGIDCSIGFRMLATKSGMEVLCSENIRITIHACAGAWLSEALSRNL